MTYDITIDGKNHRLELDRVEGRWLCRLDGLAIEVDAILARPDVLSLRIGNRAYEIKSPKKGTIQKLLVTEGATVNAGDVLAIVE